MSQSAINEEYSEDEVYEGPPDGVSRDRDGKQDEED